MHLELIILIPNNHKFHFGCFNLTGKNHKFLADMRRLFEEIPNFERNLKLSSIKTYSIYGAKC